jgi:hypothetical protein
VFSWADLLWTVGVLAYQGCWLFAAATIWMTSRRTDRPFPWGGIAIAVATGFVGSAAAFLVLGFALYPAPMDR